MDERTCAFLPVRPRAGAAAVRRSASEPRPGGPVPATSSRKAISTPAHSSMRAPSNVVNPRDCPVTQSVMTEVCRDAARNCRFPGAHPVVNSAPTKTTWVEILRRPAHHRPRLGLAGLEGECGRKRRPRRLRPCLCGERARGHCPYRRSAGSGSRRRPRSLPAISRSSTPSSAGLLRIPRRTCSASIRPAGRRSRPRSRSRRGGSRYGPSARTATPRGSARSSSFPRGEPVASGLAGARPGKGVASPDPTPTTRLPPRATLESTGTDPVITGEPPEEQGVRAPSRTGRVRPVTAVE